MTVTFLFCSIKPHLCILEPTRPHSGEHLALLVKCQCFPEPM